MALGRGGRDIAIAGGGGTLPAYRSLPASGRGFGVLVVHEGDGLLDFTRDVCDRLAREGFVALAPDLFRGESAADAEQAARRVEGLDVDRAASDLDAGVAELLNADAVVGARVGVLGFCMGGQLALLAGARNRRVGAVVDVYGAHPRVKPDLEGLACPVLAIIGGADARVPGEAVEALRSQLDAAGVRAAFRVEPGLAHGFMNETRADAYDAVAAAAAWASLLAFLRAELS